MNIKNAKFIISVANKENLLDDNIPEIAFVGRSNVGKSSLINSLTRVNKLAKTSGTPGRTRLINYFSINDDAFRFVDLPGYGYAKAGKQNKALWASLIEDYLLSTKDLKLIILLVDIRHNPTELDKLMQHFLFTHGLPCIIVATKSDKLAKSKIINFAKSAATTLSVGIDNIYPYSATTGAGKEKLLEKIEYYLNVEV